MRQTRQKKRIRSMPWCVMAFGLACLGLQAGLALADVKGHIRAPEKFLKTSNHHDRDRYKGKLYHSYRDPSRRAYNQGYRDGRQDQRRDHKRRKKYRDHYYDDRYRDERRAFRKGYRQGRREERRDYLDNKYRDYKYRDQRNRDKKYRRYRDRYHDYYRRSHFGLDRLSVFLGTNGSDVQVGVGARASNVTSRGVYSSYRQPSHHSTDNLYRHCHFHNHPNNSHHQQHDHCHKHPQNSYRHDHSHL